MNSIEELNKENNGCTSCSCVDTIIANSKADNGFDVLGIIRSNFFIAVSLVTNDIYIRERIDKLIEATNTIEEEYKDAVKKFVSVVSSSRKLFECKARAIFEDQYKEDLWDEIREVISLGSMGYMIECALQVAKFRPIVEDSELCNLMRGTLGDIATCCETIDESGSRCYIHIRNKHLHLDLPIGI